MPAVSNDILELKNKLNDYAYQYYVLDDPTISDGEYDKLYHQRS